MFFIDSIHTYDQSSWELMTFEPQVREGGYIVMHDSLYFDGIGRAAKHLYDNPRFEVIPADLSASHDRRSSTDGLHHRSKVRRGAPISRDPSWIPAPEGVPSGRQPLLRTNSLQASEA